MVLYKYMPYRRSFFENLMLRATGKDSLNDPFEFEPSVEYVSDVLLKTANTTLGTSKKEIEDNHSSLTGFHISKDTGWAIQRRFGVISMSETNDNLLMWSHYASNHKGVVIGFDANHNFFTSKHKEENFDYAGKIHRVIYRKRRIASSDQFSELFFTKSDEWMYEKEHRFIVQLRRCDKCLLHKSDFDEAPIITKAFIYSAQKSSFDDSFYDIEIHEEKDKARIAETSIVCAMFEIPKSAIVSIGFGARMSIDDRISAVNAIRSTFGNNAPSLYMYSRDKYRYDVFPQPFDINS